MFRADRADTLNILAIAARKRASTIISRLVIKYSGLHRTLLAIRSWRKGAIGTVAAFSRNHEVLRHCSTLLHTAPHYCTTAGSPALAYILAQLHACITSQHRVCDDLRCSRDVCAAASDLWPHSFAVIVVCPLRLSMPCCAIGRRQCAAQPGLWA